MQEAGMPLLECIKAATLSAADLLGATDIIGSIETGKFADIVAVEGDPSVSAKMKRNSLIFC